MLSGALLSSTGMNGPPLVLALRHLPPLRFRATLQSTFLGQDTIAVAGMFLLGHLSGEAVVIASIGVLAMPLGWLVGDRLFVRLGNDVVRYLILAALAATGVSMLLT